MVHSSDPALPQAPADRIPLGGASAVLAEKAQPVTGFRITPIVQTEGDQGTLILVVETGTPGTLIGTATEDLAGSGTWDEWTLRAANNHSSDVVLTVEWSGAGNPFSINIPFDEGFFDVILDQPLRDAGEIRAFAGTTNVIQIAVKRVRISGGKEESSA